MHKEDMTIVKQELSETKLYLELIDGTKVIYDINDVIGVEETGDAVTIHVINRLKDNRWRKKSLQLCGDKDTCQKFISDVNSKLLTISSRPRSLLVLLNPIAGSQTVNSIYEELITQLFKLAKIAIDTKVTAKHQDILEILETYPIENVDGIAVCGGDGSFGQCVNGVFKRTQRSLNIDYNDPNTSLKSTTIPIGHIPTGSYNLSSRFCNGCVDIETAVLTIITGSTNKLGIANVYTDNKWISGSCHGVGHGNLSEFAVYADQFRWMKAARILTMLPYYLLFKTRPRIEAAITLLYRNEDSDDSDDIIEGSLKRPLTFIKTRVTNIQSSPFVLLYTSISAETLEGIYLDIALGCHDALKSDHYIGSPDWFSDHAILHIFTEECSVKRLVWDYIKRYIEGDNQVDSKLIKQLKVIGYKIKIRNSNINHSAEEGKIVYYLTLHGEKLELTTSDWEVRLHDAIVTVFSGLG